MKNWVKRIGQNKFQFFFFVGVLAFLFLALILAGTLGLNQTTDPEPNAPTNPKNNDDTPAITETVETVKLPFNETMSYSVVRKFYDRNATKEEQELSLIKYGSSYRTSVGTSYAKTDNSSFEVLAVLSGKVLEVKENPLYGNYVVLEHSNNIKTYYYGLSEVTTAVGSTINQGDKLGVSGTTEIDSAAGNHVYVQILKESKHLNPEKTIGKKITDL